MGATLAIVLAILLAGCGGGDEDAAPEQFTGVPLELQDPGPVHVHGLGYDTSSNVLYIATHTGMFELPAGAAKATRIGDDILATQQAEIDQMKAWRSEWFGSSEIDPNGGAALGMSDSATGMMGDAETLRTSGDANTDFAQMMVTHHQGAIEMAKLAPDRAEHQEIKDLAEAIVSAQEREIEVMKPHAGGTMDHG